MKMPNSVSGADRTSAADIARRPASKRGEGGEEFGSALSAELDKPKRDETTGTDGRDAAARRAAGDRADQLHAARRAEAGPAADAVAAGTEAAGLF
ncbi:hypothetical protein, partial [Paractinoplanes abujensis]